MAVDEAVLHRIQALLERTKRGKFESLEAFKAREGEVENATVLAQKMLREYNLEIHQVESAQGKGSSVDVTREFVLMDDKLKNMPFRWMVEIGAGVAETCMCQVLFSSYSRTLTFIGRPTDIAVAKTLYSYLRDQCKEMANYAASDPRVNVYREHSLAFKPPYLFGLACRVRERLEEEHYEAQRKQTTVGAMVRVWKEAISTYVQKEYPHLKSGERYRPVHGWAVNAGYRDGDKVSLQKRERVEA